MWTINKYYKYMYKYINTLFLISLSLSPKNGFPRLKILGIPSLCNGHVMAFSSKQTLIIKEAVYRLYHEFD